MQPIISTRELAQAINVSESSLKRWADDGLIKVARTAGGHRRIPIGEAIRFIRATRSPVVRPDILGLDDLSPAGEHIASPEAPADRLFDHLREGRTREARGLILALYLAGEGVAEIADGPIQSAMERLGVLWRHEPAGIYIEHRALDICVQCVQHLRQFVESKPAGPTAVGAAGPCDPYLLPSLLAATALAAEGWQAVNLGADTPIASLRLAVDWHAARLAWVSISVVENPEVLTERLAELAAGLAARGVTLVAGGRGVANLKLEHLPLRVETSIAGLVGIAREIQGAADARGSAPAALAAPASGGNQPAM